MSLKSHRAWAIELRLRDHPSPCFLGILGPAGEPAPHLRGCRTALWQTRHEARWYLWDKKQREGERPDGIYYWRRAVVRPVDVSITVRQRVRHLKAKP